MTYLHLVKQLTAIGSDAPSHEAAEIIRVTSGKSREWCLANRDAELPPSVSEALAKREKGIPLQYILGEAWFYGNRFTVSDACLIPQPDTEHCVSLALSHLPTGGKLLDLCTGSGCIAISILKENVTAHGVAVDISEAALGIAKQNSTENGTDERLSFVRADLLSDNITSHISDSDVIVSNPPYINTDIIDTLSAEVRHEPRIALDGGEDGMIFYRHFIENFTKHMKPSAVMILEIGYDQAERIAELCGNNNLTCRLHRDFGSNIRVAEVRVNRALCE